MKRSHTLQIMLDGDPDSLRDIALELERIVRTAIEAGRLDHPGRFSLYPRRDLAASGCHDCQRGIGITELELGPLNEPCAIHAKPDYKRRVGVAIARSLTGRVGRSYRRRS